MTDHICSDHLICSLGHQPSVNRMLHELGHFADVDDGGWAIDNPTYEEVCELVPSAIALQDAIASYQRLRPWLREDGEFGEVTLMASRQELGLRCGCPDVMANRANAAEWPEDCQGNVTTSFDDARMKHDLDGKTPAEVWDEGNAVWNEVCGIILSTVEPGNDARIRAIMGSMGGGTLAWSYLANGSCSSRLRQEYNRSRTWDLHSFLWVNAHEKGHALGLSHTGQKGNIMQPYYSPGLSKLGPWEIAQVVKRYGPTAAPPTPPTPEPPTPPVPPTPGPIGTVKVAIEWKLGEEGGGIVEVTLPDGSEHAGDLVPRSRR